MSSAILLWLTCGILANLLPTIAHSQTILLVKSSDGDGPLNSEEQARKSQFESWGYAVNTIGSDSSQTEFDSAVEEANVAYVPVTIEQWKLEHKLRTAPIGVLNEERYLDSQFGFSSNSGWDTSYSSIVITDNTHPVSGSFSTGNLTIFNSSQPLALMNPDYAPGLQVLAEQHFGNKALAVLETGAALANSHNGNNTASGRRVRLPWGGDWFSWSSLNSNGLQLAKNALEWATVENNALVLHLKLDETSGTLAEDSSEKGNDGTVHGGGTWTDAVRAGGHGFDYTDGEDYVAVPNSSSLENVQEGSFSIAAWFKPHSVPPGSDSDNDAAYGIVIKSGWHLGLYYNNNQQFQLDQFLEGDVWAGTGTWNDTYHPGRFYHVVGVVDRAAGEVKIYVDGKLKQTSSFTPGAETREHDTALWRVGIASPGATSWGWAADGTIDDVRIYNYAITEEEIAELHGLISHWSFAEGSGTTSSDSTPFANHVSIAGANWKTTCSGENAVEFDGLGDSAATNNEFDPPAHGSVAFWMQSSGNPSTQNALFGIEDNWEVTQETDGSLNFDLGAEGATEFVTTTDLNQQDRWYHIVAGYDADSDKYQVYVDGELQKVGTHSGNIAEQLSGYLCFGTRMGSSQYWEGALRDFRVYNRFLLDYEIAELSGLVGHWRFDETSGILAADSSVLGTDGSYVNGVELQTDGPSPSKTNTAADFDGDNDHVVIPHHIAMLANTGGIAFWYKSRSLSKTQGLFSKDALNFGTGGHITVRQVNGRINARLQSTSDAYTLESDVLSANKWHHVAVLWGSTGLQLYIDGNLEASNSLYSGGLGSSSGGSGNTEPISVGVNSWASSSGSVTPMQDYFDGVIDELYFYRRPLCPKDVMNLYKGGRPGGVRIIQWVEVR